jgi:FkbM family methyltransferase
MKDGGPLFRMLELYGTRIRHPGQWRAHAFLRTLLKASPTGERRVTRRGLHWILDPADYTQQTLFWLGVRDRWEIFHLTRLLTRGSVILDVGANLGYYSVVLAKALAGDCVVYAFEPVGATFNRLVKHIALNGLEGVVRPLALAVSSSAGSGRMVSPPDNSGAAHLVGSDGLDETQVTTIDAFCAAHALTNVQLIKLDVEGSEYAALRGARQLLRECRPTLMVEVHPCTLKRSGVSADDLLALVRSYGYALYVPRRAKLHPLTEVPSGNDYTNVFCLHPLGPRLERSSGGQMGS